MKNSKLSDEMYFELTEDYEDSTETLNTEEESYEHTVAPKVYFHLRHLFFSFV